MKVLLTGGTGFLGAALCSELVAARHEVVVLDDNSRGRAARLALLGEGVTVLEGDIRRYTDVRAAVEGCEVVWHLAYINGTRYFYERPADVLDVGVRGTLNVVDAAVNEGVRRLVLASTSETYNEPSVVPTPEEEWLKIPDVTNPRFSYGGGKIACELLALHMAGPRGVEPVIFRPHNLYGPDMGFEHVIPEIVEKIVQLKAASPEIPLQLPIQGDGTETRAFCHVRDGARGAFLAGELGKAGAIYHVGTMHEVSIRELVDLISEILDVPITIVPGPLRAGGTSRRCPDITKLSEIGYSPEVDLREGLGETVAWYADYFGARATS
ncbi:NAD-dependent epimerase/dehydratase family protein [Pseudonocardia halophobica]|uniref:Nucleoside-diphosphate sugar epimerase n=1 Tax=Pseudonocardia halophobica TaxID=29401 RepID=A0A9W6L4P1_9PSEU|nr:NAD-dependent epimerase/dehydratase family protein [Pseudonocardia halophobica]GLL12050.1 nucleoside-diphosphate sugar epimerase [Pseudonocardia halophobica]